LDAPLVRLKHAPGVPRRVFHGRHYGQTELERHIETRGAGAAQIQLDAREIVKRIAAASYQGYDPVQAALSAGHLKRRPRRQTK